MSFPSLADVKDVKVSKKKKKAQAMSLADFNSGAYKPRRTNMTADEEDNLIMMNLPSAPRYTREEGGGPGLGGGFDDYGGDRGGWGRDDDGYGDRDREEDLGPSRADEDDDWGKSKKSAPRHDDRGYDDRGYDDYDRPRRRGFDDYNDRGYDDREDFGPSRADEDANWGKSKKGNPPLGDRDRYPGSGSGFSDRYDDREREDFGPSRADEDRDWGKSKKFVPTSAENEFRERPGFRADAADKWERKPAGPDAALDREEYRERPGLRADAADKWTRSGSDTALDSRDGPSPGGARPKLQLAKRSAAADKPAEGEADAARPSLFGAAKPVAVKEVEDVVRAPPPREADRWERKGPSAVADAPRSDYAPRGEARGDGRWGRGERGSSPPEAEPRPAGERTSSRKRLQLKPRSAAEPVAAVAAADRASPFGAARPREEALAQQGRDWREEDAKLDRVVKRPEAAEERTLREALASLKMLVEDGKGGDKTDLDDDAPTVAEKLAEVEKELAALSQTLDEKFKLEKDKPKEAKGARADKEDRWSRGQAPPKKDWTDRKAPKPDKWADKNKAKAKAAAAAKAAAEAEAAEAAPKAAEAAAPKAEAEA